MGSENAWNWAGVKPKIQTHPVDPFYKTSKTKTLESFRKASFFNTVDKYL